MMKRLVAAAVLFIALSVLPHAATAGIDDAVNADILIVSGVLTNTHGEAVAGAEVSLLITASQGKTSRQTISDDSGRFEIKSLFPAGSLADAPIVLHVRKPSYAPSARVTLHPVAAAISDTRSTVFLAEANLTLRRVTSPALWITAAVLAMVYVMIGFDLVHRTLAAMAGAALLLGCTHILGPSYPDLKIITFDVAARAVDLNVIVLLFSMMIIVAVSEKTGMFQWLAHQCFELSGGRVPLLVVALMTVTAVISAFLDNVTTMLLVIPVTIQIAMALRISPIALLLPEVFASNVGGTATLIGDPPNIMIGSYARLSFIDFITNLGLPCLLILVVSMAFFLIYYRKAYAAAVPVRETDSQETQAHRIKDSRLLALALIFISMTVALFLLHGRLDMPPSVAALLGATGLLLVSRLDIVGVLEKKIEWSTLVFFAALFIVVAAAEQSGLIHLVADGVKSLSTDSLVTAVILVLWVSAIVSAVIDNIPFTATMLPVVGYLTAAIPGADAGILWWALALGACLGGNGTVIGASANVVTVGMAEKAGFGITFLQYAKICFPPMIISVAVSMVWLLYKMP